MNTHFKLVTIKSHIHIHVKCGCLAFLSNLLSSMFTERDACQNLHEWKLRTKNNDKVVLFNQLNDFFIFFFFCLRLPWQVILIVNDLIETIWRDFYRKRYVMMSLNGLRNWFLRWNLIINKISSELFDVETQINYHLDLSICFYLITELTSRSL